MHDALTTIEAAVTHAGLPGLSLRPPQTDAGLDILDDDLRAPIQNLLAVADGQSPEFGDHGLDWLPQGIRLFSAEEIRRVWSDQRRFDDDFEDEWKQDQGRVRSVLSHPRRVQIWATRTFRRKGAPTSTAFREPAARSARSSWP